MILHYDMQLSYLQYQCDGKIMIILLVRVVSKDNMKQWSKLDAMLYDIVV